MLRDPHEAQRFASDHQLQLGREAASARLAADVPGRRGAHKAPVVARMSHVVLAFGLWLRAHGERQPSAETISAGGWHALPLSLLLIGKDKTTSVAVRWPVYTLSPQVIERGSGYVILPATWAPADGHMVGHADGVDARA